MIDKILINKAYKEHKRYISLREEVIKSSRQILRLSKQAIFLLHRDDIKKAEECLNKAEKFLMDMVALFKKEKKLWYEGSYKDCAEEFVEAKMFFEFIKNKKVGIRTEVELSFDDILGGISDLTGEILRKAVQAATQGRYGELSRFKQAMEAIMGELINFDFTGKLRMKYDAAKRNLKRMEEIMYDINIKGLSKK